MSLKPKLNDDHLLNRLYHCISKIDKNTITGTAELKYKTMHNEVHVDEKWFYLVKDGGRYILAANEVDPPPVSVAHKSHITKVMNQLNTLLSITVLLTLCWETGYYCCSVWFNEFHFGLLELSCRD
jgi:hypothetical protein